MKEFTEYEMQKADFSAYFAKNGRYLPRFAK